MAEGLFAKVAFGGVDLDLEDERPIVLLRADLIEEGFEVDAEHRAALGRVRDARTTLDDLQRKDDGLLEALRNGGPFGDFEARNAEEMRAEREALAVRIKEALDAVREAEAEEEALRDRLSRDFVALEIARYKPAKPEDR